MLTWMTSSWCVAPRSYLNVRPQACPPDGCSLDFDTPDSLRGTLYWSDANTWLYRPGGKPKDVRLLGWAGRDLMQAHSSRT